MIVAKDIMAPAVVSVSPETPLEEAMDIILENQISGLPVIDGAGRLVGIISEADRLKVAMNNSDEGDKFVSDFMSPGVITVEENTPLVQISDLLMRMGIRRVPVMRGSTVVGSVSRRDLVRILQEESDDLVSTTKFGKSY